MIDRHSSGRCSLEDTRYDRGTTDELGLRLPEAASPSFNYVPVTLHRGVAYVAGQLPKVDGDVRVSGKVGARIDLATAREEARVCILQGLACLQAGPGLARPDRARPQDVGLRGLRTGLQRSAEGARRRLRPPGARSSASVVGMPRSVGVAELPRNAVVEIELTVAYTD